MYFEKLRISVKLFKIDFNVRGFSCYYKSYTKGNELVTNSNSACWAGVKMELQSGSDYIYIFKYIDESTSEYIDDFLKIINEITECCIVKIDNIEHIKFKLLKTYDQNLILLNFIRNLWYSQFDKYSESFFENLFKSKYEDPLQKLLDAHKIACVPMEHSWRDHSNCVKSENIQIKKKEFLYNYNGRSVDEFLKLKDNTEG